MLGFTCSCLGTLNKKKNIGIPTAGVPTTVAVKLVVNFPTINCLQSCFRQHFGFALCNFKTTHFKVAFSCGHPKARTFAIIVLSNRRLYLTHLWGGRGSDHLCKVYCRFKHIQQYLREIGPFCWTCEVLGL